MHDIVSFLRAHSIDAERFEHPAVFTCEESDALGLDLPGVGTKNLFLRDGKGSRHFLVVVGHDTQVDLKALKPLMGVQKLSFASPERLKELLGVEPGSATLLGLIADTDHAVEVVIDQPLWNADALQCHPLVNTATMVISHAGIERFLEATGHTPRILKLPARSPLKRA